MEENPFPAASDTEHVRLDGGGGSQRLSVQDRINLFENKQKEQTIKSKIISSNVVNWAASWKGDQRSQASDVSDKLILRRWSGPSGLSTDHSRSDFRYPTGELPPHYDLCGVNDQPTSHAQSHTFTEGGDKVQMKNEGLSALDIQASSSSTVHPDPRSQGTNSPSTVAEADGREEAATKQCFGPVPIKGEELGHLAINLYDKSPAGNYIKKFQGGGVNLDGKKWSAFPVKNTKESVQLLGAPSASSEKVQIERLLNRGHQELNERLKMQYNRLGKSFNVEKLRIQKDQTTNFQKSKQAAIHKDNVKEPWDKEDEMTLSDQLPEWKFVRVSSKSEVEYDASLQSNVVDDKEHQSKLRQKIGTELDDPKGKFYDKYTQKRNAKLLEEWESNRSQKEAKMKAMRDSLELSLTEMRIKFAGISDRKNSNHSRHFTENLISLKRPSASRYKDQRN